MSDDASRPKLEKRRARPRTTRAYGADTEPANSTSINLSPPQAASVAGVETLLAKLPHHSISQAKDFVRLHSKEEKYWSPELCFVSVPIKGQKHDTVHLIARVWQITPSAPRQNPPVPPGARHQAARRILLVPRPVANLDNVWNATNLQACEQAKTLWTQQPREESRMSKATKSTWRVIKTPFPHQSGQRNRLNAARRYLRGLMIETADHPGLLRLVGAKVS